MKRIPGVLAALMLSACTHTYDVGVMADTPASQMTTIEFDNRIKVSKIDEEPFDRAATLWVDGTHIVDLPPGRHSFRFRFNSVSANGYGVYTAEDTVLARYLHAGERYEIAYESEGGKMLFEIVRIDDP